MLDLAPGTFDTTADHPFGYTEWLSHQPHAIMTEPEREAASAVQQDTSSAMAEAQRMHSLDPKRP